MARGALYNRWRSQTFADILGQEHITRTLQNQIRAGRIAHAYLFTGLRGTGKTSTARVMAKAVNCVGETDTPPCNLCPVCRSITEGRSTDLFEIDGASNRGIDEIRALRENVAFSPSEGRFKVYVIDEVHMLTNEAFNALLKTLEEPPSHVIFILCTTEPHRLPDTVLSRCQRFDFRRGSVATITAKLRRICDREGIAISDRALTLVARRATGSFRDAESLLDQLSSFGVDEITEEQVQAVLGTVETDLVLGLVEGLVRGDVGTGLAAIAGAMDQGAEPRQLLAEVVEALRSLMLIMVGRGDDAVSLADADRVRLQGLVSSGQARLEHVVASLRRFADAASQIRAASRPELPIELAYVESAMAMGDGDKGTSSATGAAPAQARPVSQTERQHTGRPHNSASAEAAPPLHRVREEAAQEPPSAAAVSVLGAADEAGEPEPSSESERPGPTTTLSIDWVRGNWRRVQNKAMVHDPRVGALLRSAYPIRLAADQIVLGCGGDFHRRQLMEDKKRSYVETLLADVLGRPCRITCTLDPDAALQAGQGGSTEGASAVENGSLFAANDGRVDAESYLRNHPIVKELERQGGQVQGIQLITNGQREG
jgi:DNA polymerase-3 subunit gamma/tau